MKVWGNNVYRIAAFLLTVSAVNLSLANDLDSVQNYLSNRADQTQFSGVVLLKKGESVIYNKAFGFADRELDVELNTDSILRIGSLTKPITATAILMLMDQNQMGLDDSVCKYVRNCPGAWQEVSLEHLMNHTSGIQDYFGDLDSVPVEETVSEVDRLLETLESSPLESEPGSEFSYSNFNYVLLGYVIEAMTGTYWEQFLVEKMFDPLQMEHTRYDDVWALVPGRAHGYSVKDGVVVKSEYDDHAAYAAGGLRSTASDLAVWHTAYKDHLLISEKSRELATTPALQNYGLGWQILNLFGQQMYNHSGGIDGFTSHLAYYPGEQLLLVVLSNSDREDSKATACDIAALLFDQEPLPTGTQEWMGTPRNERCRQAN